MAKQRWKDKYRPAAFRGVRFYVDSVELEGGRRGPDHEFPDRDEPFAEDNGRKQIKYNIEGYFVGPDYFAGKNLLIKALQKKGPGDLIHPYYGKKRVVVRDFTVKESSGEGGIAKFSMKFVEAGSLIFPKQGSDRAFLVGLAGSLLGAGAASALESAFSVADQAEFVVESATDKVLELTETMDSISAGIKSAGDPLAELAFAVRNMTASAGDLVRAPGELASSISESFGLLFAAASPDEAFAAFKKMFGFGLSDVPIVGATASRVQQAANLSVFNSYVQTMALVYAANAAVLLPYKSFEDAIGARDELADHLDFLMLNTQSDDLFSLLQAERAEIVNAIPGDNENLARISQIVLPATTTSLALSYELYGNVDEEQDVIDRNRVRRPGFVPGGTPLEVLDRG